VAAMIVSGLMLWSIPATVQVELTTKRIEFVVDTAQGQGQAIVGSLDAAQSGFQPFS
jgi:hypothetical protein